MKKTTYTIILFYKKPLYLFNSCLFFYLGENVKSFCLCQKGCLKGHTTVYDTHTKPGYTDIVGRIGFKIILTFTFSVRESVTSVSPARLSLNKVIRQGLRP